MSISSQVIWCVVIRGAGLQRTGAIICAVSMYCVGGPIGLSLELLTPLGISGSFILLKVAV